MKKSILLLFLLLLSFSYAQKLPVLDLRSEAGSYVHIGIRGLAQNDICIILGSSASGEPVTSYTVYVFQEKGSIAAYQKKSALSSERIELLEENKTALSEIIHSGKFKKFMKYNQEDFEFKNGKKWNEALPLRIYSPYSSLTVIQNGKQNTYSYLKSDQDRVNKNVLKKYMAVLDMFRNVKKQLEKH